MNHVISLEYIDFDDSYGAALALTQDPTAAAIAASDMDNPAQMMAAAGGKKYVCFSLTYIRCQPFLIFVTIFMVFRDCHVFLRK